MKKQYLLTPAINLLFLLATSVAFAATGLPWETPLTTIMSSITGPVALGVALVAIAVTGGMLIFGGEISEFGKRSAYVVLVLGILTAAGTVITVLYPAAGGAGAII